MINNPAEPKIMNKFSALILATLFFAPLAQAEDPSPEIVARDKQFFPAEITIPAKTKVRLLVKNQESIPIEFESTDMSREVVIMHNTEKAIFVGPLEPGRYSFYNDFNRKAHGTIIVK
jgi:hypothetical protein